MGFTVIATSLAVLAGAVASVTGFGIGSLLTPLLAMKIGTKLAVAAVSIPHFFGTAVRCWMLRRDIDKKVLIAFGITSAIGGLSGALIHSVIRNPALSLVFGGILTFAGFIGLTGLSERFRLSGWFAWIAGAVSGLLGGLVGNQGGIRSAALLAFELDPKAFVATATAIGIFVDVARMPVYFLSEFSQIATNWLLVGATSIGVLLGTFLGTAFLKNIDKKFFKKVVSGVILALGLWMLFQNIHWTPG